MTEVKVYSLSEIESNKQEWNITAVINNNIAQTYEWALYRSCKRIEPLFLTLMDDREWLAKWLVFKQWMGVGVILDIDSEIMFNPAKINSESKEWVYSEMIKFLEKMNPIEINWLNYSLSRLSEISILKSNGFTNIVKYNAYLIDLTNSETLLWKSLSRKHRNDIRYAIKAGIKIQEMNNVDIYHILSDETYKRSGLKGISKMALARLYKILAPLKMARVFIAYYKKQPMAGAFILGCGDKAIYYKGATVSQSIRGSSNLLQWYLITLLKQEGYKIYDLGGVSLEDKSRKARGIELFKSQFGGDEKIYYGGTKVLSLWKAKGIKIIRFLKSKWWL